MSWNVYCIAGQNKSDLAVDELDVFEWIQRSRYQQREFINVASEAEI